MPQFEIKDADPAKPVRVVRARTMEDAARSCFDLDTAVDVSVIRPVGFESLSGWLDIQVDGNGIGQIREFQRMKFRRA